MTSLGVLETFAVFELFWVEYTPSGERQSEGQIFPLCGGVVSWVKIESLTNTQELPLELSETAVSSSIFTGVFVADDNAAAAAGRIVVGQGPAASSLVSVEYQDPTSGIRSSTARLQTNGEMSMSSEGSSSQVRVGDSVTVTVSDGDRNIDFDHPDSVIVKMKTHTEKQICIYEGI